MEMIEELSLLISQLRTYQPMGSLPQPRALNFIMDYPRFIRSLENINNMIGLNRIKQQVADQIKGFIVNNRRFNKPTNGELLNTLLYGPPGCGKTQLGRYLAELWACSGCLPKQDSPVFSSQNKSGHIINIQNDSEKTNLKQNLAVREARIKHYQDEIREIRNSSGQIVTLLNNVRKKIKAKDSFREDQIQSKFQYIKQKLKINAGYVFTPNMLSSGGAQVLPVTIPKLPGTCSVFGTANPPLLPQVPNSLNILSQLPDVSTVPKAKFTVITRGDLIGKYQGHSTDKVRQLLNEYIGGVVMIDEAYTLLTSSHDDFGKEALTEIISFMTTHSDKIIFILAGYRKDMEKSVLKFQPGLARRFNWTFEVDEYDEKELSLIFQQQLKHIDPSWNLSEKTLQATQQFFQKNKHKFPHYGGDTERLCKFVQEACYGNNWSSALDDTLSSEQIENLFNSVSIELIERGFEMFLKNSAKELETQSEKMSDAAIRMYN